MTKRTAAIAALIFGSYTGAAIDQAQATTSLPDCQPGMTVVMHLEDFTECNLNPGDTLAAIITRPDEYAYCAADGRKIVVIVSLMGQTVGMCVGLDF